MARMTLLRFSSKVAQVAQGGTVFNHGLGPFTPNGLPPDEWFGNLRGPTPGAASIYLNAITSTSMTWCASGANGTADVFCCVNHSFMK